MDKNLEQIIELSDKFLSFKIKRHALKEKFQARTTVGHNGGIFKIDQSFISYLKTLLDLGKETQVILLDINGNPIVIDNLKVFFHESLDKYFSAIGEYHAGVHDLKQTKPQLWDITNVDKK
jgi:hypothetical protein